MAKDSIKERSSGYPGMNPVILNTKVNKKSPRGRRSDDFRARFLNNLIEKKQELEETIDYLISGQKEDIGKSSSDNYIDELDRADKEIYTQSYYKFLDRKKKELKRVDILIERIQREQDFGICEECGKLIPEGRLLIIPEAVLCVPCQKELEKFESRISISSKSNNHSHSKYDYSIQSEDNMDDDGVVMKPDTERMSLMDLDEIELDDTPETSDNEKSA
jgi:DnaK suppressor protein